MSRRQERVGTKTKVLKPGGAGPLPKSRYSRVWKLDGRFMPTAANPRYTEKVG